jgi:hypothetical protein
MSEDTSDGFADKPRQMVKCIGCGFNVEREDARGEVSTGYNNSGFQKEECATCVKCVASPDIRKSYRRGFDAGVESMRQQVASIISRR